MRTLLGLALALLTGCTASTEATEVGVRTVNLTLVGGRGVVQDIYPQGQTYFFLRPLSDWTVFDVGLQNLVMHRSSDPQVEDAVRFKTVDGNDVSVDLTIAWSIDPTKAPHLLQRVGRSTEEVGDKLVRPVSRTIVRDVLNKLTSEEYYQADRRFQMAEMARTKLNEILNPEGIQVEQVLLGEHQFNTTYEQIIRDKKVAEQETARLASETEAASEEMKRDLEKAKGEVSKTIEQARGGSAQRTLEADAIFFERERQATAILAEKKARAEGLTAQARALAGAGGRAMVKLEVARALAGKKFVFVPAGGGMDVRSTDMNTLLQTYGVQSITKSTPTP